MHYYVSAKAQRKQTGDNLSQAPLDTTVESTRAKSLPSTFGGSERVMKFLKLPLVTTGDYELGGKFRKPVMKFERYSSRPAPSRLLHSHSMPVMIPKPIVNRKTTRPTMNQTPKFQRIKSNPSLGPGTYDCGYYYRAKAGPKFPQAIVDRLRVNTYTAKGPGDYDIRLIKKPLISYSFRVDAGSNVHQKIKQYQQTKLPGPAQYEPIKPVGSSPLTKWSMSRVPQRENRKSQGPGPGSYLQLTSMKGGRQSQQNPPLIRPRYQMKTSPGPGSYNLHRHKQSMHQDFPRGVRKDEFLKPSLTSLETPGPQLNFGTYKKVFGTFSKAKKPDLFMITDTPAAGSYELSIPLLKPKKVIIRPTNFSFDPLKLQAITIDLGELSAPKYMNDEQQDQFE